MSHMTQTANPVTLTSYSSPCGRYHNPRPERPSNLRTLRPSGRSILRTLTPKVCPRAIHNPRGQRPRQTYEPLGPQGPSILRTFFPQPFYTTCLRQQAITFGPQARPLSEPSETCGLGPFGTAYHLSARKQWHNKDFKFLLFSPPFRCKLFKIDIFYSFSLNILTKNVKLFMMIPASTGI